ncbi:hypothetical protein CLCR_06458 [Cladophialophora carrionii]|uniref:Uncharacterized protein n=1 Tax=Cladophialophora carrionii TaxID=86049 RepID=A0A1C1C9G8_9EURO|nr:hypothetical protein CLCR_06458 [Cladophialophora carrionii]
MAKRDSLFDSDGEADANNVRNPGNVQTAESSFPKSTQQQYQNEARAQHYEVTTSHPIVLPLPGNGRAQALLERHLSGVCLVQVLRMSDSSRVSRTTTSYGWMGNPRW